MDDLEAGRLVAPFDAKLEASYGYWFVFGSVLRWFNVGFGHYQVTLTLEKSSLQSPSTVLGP